MNPSLTTQAMRTWAASPSGDQTLSPTLLQRQLSETSLTQLAQSLEAIKQQNPSLAQTMHIQNNTAMAVEGEQSTSPYMCQWRVPATDARGIEVEGQQRICSLDFSGGSELFNHLSEVHVGRKTTANLCLQCKWSDCVHVTVKRDHIISHIRTHVPSFKPFPCSVGEIF